MRVTGCWNGKVFVLTLHQRRGDVARKS